MFVCAGDDFDIRDFHEQILRLGPVPTHVVEMVVYQWIRTQALEPVVVGNSLTTGAAFLFCLAAVRFL